MSLIIQPGLDAPSVANMVELARVDSVRRVNVSLLDATGTPVDIDKGTTQAGAATGALDLTITDVAENVVFSESYWPKSNLPGATSRIKHAGVGQYYIDLGTEDDELDEARQLLCNWHARINATSEDVYSTQVLEVVSTRTLSMLPAFRLLLDKVVKPVLPDQYVYVGFSDSMLIVYLQLGLSMCNSYQPYPVFLNLDAYPLATHAHVLQRAALYQAITSQLIFSIDTDVPSFSDSGHSFVQVHATPLASYLTQLKAELDHIIPQMKLQFVNSGSMALEVQMNQAYAAMLATAPGGSVFRGIWQGGPL